MPYDTKAGRWSDAERELLVRFFSANWSLTTLFFKIHALNSSRTPDAVGREIRRYREQGWEKSREVAMRKFRVGYFDIETSNLEADFGYMLCWHIKPRGTRTTEHDCITRNEIHDLSLDKRITESLLRAFKNYDILYTHWGKPRRFDIPFITARACKHDLMHLYPAKDELVIRDTWDTARRSLGISRRSLERVANIVNVKGITKTYLDTDRLMLARLGSEGDLAWVDKHCRHDVILLERAHRKLEILERPVMSSI